MIILLHSSKTMRQPELAKKTHLPVSVPQLLPQAEELAQYLKTLSPAELAKAMKVSSKLAGKTHDLLAAWTSQPDLQQPAVDCFIGDIYSGLQASKWTEANRAFAQQTLRIFSGLYGILRPLDGIYPYRLEMGYRLPATQYRDLYAFWGDRIASTLPIDGIIINTSSVEYSKTITPYVEPERIITPTFWTVDAKTGKPAFVVVHSKIARGALASWLIRHEITTSQDVTGFDDIGYKYDPRLSKPQEPAFVCQEFGGKGLSMRLVN